ncbi:hypothetical protein ACRC7T_09635 [Segnochrobactraceae bacterium EtOH-i3]
MAVRFRLTGATSRDRRGLLAPLVAGASLTLLAAVPAFSQAAGPYDMRYHVRGETQLRAAIEPGAKVIATIPAGTKGLTLRWCRSEIPFASWELGSASTWRRILDQRACEIGWGKTVGFVDGKSLEPDQ